MPDRDGGLPCALQLLGFKAVGRRQRAEGEKMAFLLPPLIALPASPASPASPLPPAFCLLPLTFCLFCLLPSLKP